MKFLSVFIFLIPLVSSIEITCNFLYDNWMTIGRTYQCIFINDPLITSLNTVITAVKGIHKFTMNNDNVQVLELYSYQKINYIPHGLNQIFHNIIAIKANYGRINEINKKDLEQFPKLKYLVLNENDIEYLEKDLFKFNKDLQYINFENNKINPIFPTVFDNLQQLQELHLQGNDCIKKNKFDRFGVLELIKEVKEKCLPPNLNEIINNEQDTNIEIIQNQLNVIFSKISDLEAKIEILTKNCKQA
ncbi:hypothetical protein PVAND_016330 [Polypedilum vanderplanki]|uniref:Leucine rich repeat protein n=1 Tax=Polypedilum vanderplanki TaxID=319348 RepID=A0A9J6BFY3_POLVA|nr:hypothetical protein PVAND_016330 [Polypedilum vanderplanki]